ncbi:MAG TPA: S-layer homology domain-containing protein [Thermoanaerobaculia bacterium]
MIGTAGRVRVRIALLSSLLAAAGAALRAQAPTFVATPLTEMGQSETYLGFSGGLYPNGANVPPPAHASAGLAHALAIRPLDTDGNPSASGRVVLLSIGMSHTTQEFCSQGGLQPCNPWTFIGQALTDTGVNHTTLALVNGARSGQTAVKWSVPTAENFDRVRDVDLAAQGLTETQVQAVWLKEADAHPMSSLPNADADAYTLETLLGDVIRSAKIRYPHLQCVFVTSRSYAGYALSDLNPEPYAYESGFAVKWIVQAQIDQMANGGAIVDPRAGDLNYDTGAPWIGWGPYLWADGTIPRGSDGLVWVPEDFEASDLTHPSTLGETKAGNMLLAFFGNDPRTRPWFLALGDVAIAPSSGDATGEAVSVTGAGFQEGAVLTIGGVGALGVSVAPGLITGTTPALQAGSLNDVVITNPDSTTGTLNGAHGFFADFTDVPQGHPFHAFVESIFRAGVTAGCGGDLYCADANVTRAEMAVFLLKSRFGPFHAPPPATGAVFDDVQPGDFAADWIEELAALGVTGGCGGGNYCPNDPVTRAQMAVFLLKTLLGSSYDPPDPVGVFADVGVGDFAADFIEDLYRRGVTGGCGTDPLLYCPANPNLRGEMAVFLTKTFLQ